MYVLACSVYGDILSAAFQSKLHRVKKEPLKVPLKTAGADLWVYEKSQITASSRAVR